MVVLAQCHNLRVLCTCWLAQGLLFQWAFPLAHRAFLCVPGFVKVRHNWTFFACIPKKSWNEKIVREISFPFVCVDFTHFKYYLCAWGEKEALERYGNIQQQLKFWVSTPSRRNWALCWEPACRQHPCKDVTKGTSSVDIFMAFPQCIKWILFHYWQNECFSSVEKRMTD